MGIRFQYPTLGARRCRGVPFLLFLSFGMLGLPGEDQVNALITPPDARRHDGHRMIETLLAYLSEGQRAEFEHALFPALEKDPALEADGAALLRAGVAQTGTAGDGALTDYRLKLKVYEARLQRAMQAEDPAIGEIFKEIDAHLDRAQ